MRHRLNSRNISKIRCVILVGIAATASGCYTMFNHPNVTADEKVNEQGQVIQPADCNSCHTGAHLGSRFHDPFGSGYDRYHPDDYGRRTLVWDPRYYYGHDPYFVDSWYYPKTYYPRWRHYHTRAWWYPYYGSSGRPQHRPSAPDPTGRDRQLYGRRKSRMGRAVVPRAAHGGEQREERALDVPVVYGSGPSGGSSTKVGQQEEPLDTPAATGGDRTSGRRRQRGTNQPKDDSAQDGDSTAKQTKEEDDDDESTGRERRSSSRRRKR